METLTEQFNRILSEIDRYEKEQRSSVIKVDKIYCLNTFNRTIDEMKVEDIRMGYEPYLSHKPQIAKRATKEAVEELIQYFESAKSAKKIFWYIAAGKGYSTRVDLSEINGKKYAYTEEELKLSLQEEIERYEKYYKPREDYTPCTHCRKQTPNDKLIYSIIIGRDSKMVWNSWKNRYEDKAYLTKTRLPFCSGECAGNEQMGREG
jgi:hypothetical protein